MSVIVSTAQILKEILVNNEITVVDVKIPFWSLVVLLIKLSIAAIPAAIIMLIFWGVASSVVSSIALGLMHR